MMVLLSRLFAMIDAAVSWLVGVALWTMTLVLFIGSLARYVADAAFIGGAELARYLMVWLAFLGSYLLVRVQRHVTVDLLANALSPCARRALDIAIGLVGAGSLGYVAWLGGQLTTLIFHSGQMMSSLPIQRGWIYLAVPIGCGLMAGAYTFQVLVLLLTGQLSHPRDASLVAAAPHAESNADRAVECARSDN